MFPLCHRYSRDADQIESSLASRWHDHEFLDAGFLAKKSYKNLGEFFSSSDLNISSSFKGLASLNTGMELRRDPGLMESSAFIQVD